MQMLSKTLMLTLVLACTSRSGVRFPDTSRPTSGRNTVRGAESSAAVFVRGPTLIAFFPRMSQAQVDSSADLSETLGDFSYHLSTALDSLRALGITVEQRPVDAIDIIEAHERRRFVPANDSSDVGYVFVAPGRHDRTFYGVMTNSDLLAKAREFLRSQDR